MEIEMQKFGNETVNRFDVVAVSEEWLALIRDIPEASTMKAATVKGKRIEGLKDVLTARSMEEVEANLPAIIAELTDPEHQHVRIVHRTGMCRSCAASGQLCPHLGVSIATLNSAYDLDISQFVGAKP